MSPFQFTFTMKAILNAPEPKKGGIADFLAMAGEAGIPVQEVKEGR